jgi:hypothetical protein
MAKAPTLKLEQALQHMRTGACLVQMHGKQHEAHHWFVVPGGPVTDDVADEIREHSSVVGGKDGLFPRHDHTWRMLRFAS